MHRVFIGKKKFVRAQKNYKLYFSLNSNGKTVYVHFFSSNDTDIKLKALGSMSDPFD